MVKISVIVPVYNVEKYLRKCLDSLINQDFKDYEIIVVNDGSPDNSEEIIEEYKKKHSKLIKAFKKENGGLSSARNFGLEKAKGEYIAFVDSDDYVTADYLSSLYNKAIKSNCDVVVCDIIKKSERCEEVLLGRAKKHKNILNDLIISLPAAWNKLYKKELFLDNNIFYPDRLYYEDLGTTPSILLNAKKIGYVNKPLYYYIVRDGSITHQKKFNPKTADMFISLGITRKYFMDNNLLDKYKEEIEYLYIVNILHSYPITIFKFKEGREGIVKASELMRELYPDFRKNKYFKKESFKYKIVCNLIYYKQVSLLKMLLK